MGADLRGLLLVSLALPVLAAGCQHSVRRAALVPHQQPIRRSGQPMGQNKQEVALGSSVLASAGSPKTPAGSNDGVVLPRWQVSGEWRLRAAHPDIDIGLVWDHGLDAGSRAASEDQPEVDHGDVMGGGVNMHYSHRASDRVRIGVAGELLLYSVPFVEYTTCADEFCSAPYTRVGEHRELVPVGSFGVIPSVELHPRVAMFAGINLRNHPTIDKGDVETLDLVQGDEVEAGPFGAVASAGVELELGGGVRALGYIYRPITAEPVIYGPTVGASIAIPLSRDRPTPEKLPRVAGR